MHKKLREVLNRQPKPVRYEYAVIICRTTDEGERGTLTNRTDDKYDHDQTLKYWQNQIDQEDSDIVEVHGVIRTIKTSAWSQMP